ncbi:MAG: hypothetical protein WKF96_13675 [Solirubrobacteraceae bacterium]
MLSRLPFFKFLAIAQVARLAGRHYRHLDEVERRRFVELLRRGRGATPDERRELRALTDKIDLRGLVGGAASRISPVPLPKRFTRARY